MENFDDMSDGSTEDITDMLKKHVASQLQRDRVPAGVRQSFYFELNSFEAMVQLASEVYLDSVTTNLYQMNDRYYLEVQFMDNDTTDIEVGECTGLF